MTKYFNVCIGLSFVALGGIGLCFPDIVAGYYGLSFHLIDGKTELRVLSGFVIGIGYLIVYFALMLQSQKAVLFSIGIMMMSFIFPRVVGLLIDGGNQPIMVKELVFELVILVVVFFLYYRELKNENNDL